MVFRVPELIDLVTRDLDYADLMTIAKMSVRCARSAQKGLFRKVRTVTPPPDGEERELVNGEKVLKTSTLARHVRILEIGGALLWSHQNVLTVKTLAGMLDSCRGVVELRLDGVYWTSNPSVSDGIFSRSLGANLTRLYLHNVRLYNGSPLELLWLPRKWTKVELSACGLRMLHTDCDPPIYAKKLETDKLSIGHLDRHMLEPLDPDGRNSLMPSCDILRLDYDKRDTIDVSFAGGKNAGTALVLPLARCSMQ